MSGRRFFSFVGGVVRVDDVGLVTLLHGVLLAVDVDPVEVVLVEEREHVGGDAAVRVGGRCGGEVPWR